MDIKHQTLWLSMFVWELGNEQGALKACHWGLTIPQRPKVPPRKSHRSQALENKGLSRLRKSGKGCLVGGNSMSKASESGELVGRTKSEQRLR